MPRKSEGLIRVHVLLKESDKEALDAFFGDSVGFSKAVRSIISQYVRQIQAKAAQGNKPLVLED